MIVFYLIMRKFKRNQLGNYYSWKEVLIEIILSLCSWIGVIVWYLTLLPTIIKEKPPKWL